MEGMASGSQGPHRGDQAAYGDHQLRYPGQQRADPAYDWAALWLVAHPDDGLGPWIVSVWGGRCRGCGELFDPGDLIRRYEDENGYLAECCGSLPAGSRMADVG
jgi:hypothetical protein